MDPSIMKLLEEDEDETMHSGADVEAFTAALNRDIEGDTSTSQSSDLDSATLSQGSNHTSSQLFSQWQTSTQDENANHQSQEDLNGSHQQTQHLSEMEPKLHGSTSDSQQQQAVTSQELNCLPLSQKHSHDDCQQLKAEADQITHQFPQTMGMQNSEKKPVHVREPDRVHNQDRESQFPKLQKTSNQQPIAPQQAINPMNRGKQVPFALLLPVIQPQLDKDRAMQLQTLYLKLKKNEISKDGFVRHIRSIVGDQMLKMAVLKLQPQAARNTQSGPNQLPLQSQASAQQHHLKMPPVGAKQFPDPQSLTQLHQKGVTSPADSSHIPSSTAQVKTDSSNAPLDNNAPKVEHQSDSHGMQVSQMSSSSMSTVNQERECHTLPIQGLSKQQQQHLHFSQPSFPPYGSTGGPHHSFSGSNVNTSTSLKQQFHDSQMRQVPVHQNMGTTQIRTTSQSNLIGVPKFERQNSISEPKRVQGGTLPHLINNPSLQHNSVHRQPLISKEQKNCVPSSMTSVKQEPVDQLNEQQNRSQLPMLQGSTPFSSGQVEQGNKIPETSIDETFEMQSSRMELSTATNMMPSNFVSSSLSSQLDPNISLSSRVPSAASPIEPGNNAKTPSKKPYIGQKKPLEAIGSSPPLSSKKQKVSGAFSDQSIEQLNDVTAVSGVNLREEEEQLFSGPKEDSRVSEASRRVVQEEEERLILQKLPLQKKLAQIMAKCGVKSISNDVEKCLSLCVEERMRGLISNMIRLSKQRVDIEKPRHRTVITSDVQQQIMVMNQKAREEWEKKQAEAEKLQKLNDPDGNPGIDGDKEKDEGRVKSIKANKEDDDKMRTTAANVAARAAVGGDDMLSKWQLMAEQARQKREGGIDVASGSQPGKDVSRKPLPTSGGNAKDNRETEKKGHTAAIVTSCSTRKFERNQVAVPHPMVPHKISIKDVISTLEREPQMSKSTLIYRLYEKMRADALAE